MVAAPESVAQVDTPQVTSPGSASQEQPITNGKVNGVEHVNGNGETAHADTPGAPEASSSPPPNLPPPDIARQIPCRFFPLGQCKYGENCAFSHAVPAGFVPPPPGAIPGQESGGIPFYPPPPPSMEYYPAHNGYYYHPYQPYPAYPPPPNGYYLQQPPPPQPAQSQSPHAENAPTSPQPSTEAPLPTAAAASSEEPVSNGASSPNHPYSPYQPQPFDATSAEANGSSSSDPSSVPASIATSAPPPSMHTFFQTSGPPVGYGPKSSSRSSFSSSSRPPRGTPSVPYPTRTGPRKFPIDPKAPKPNCAFFEANKCRNGDGCFFPHQLRDGTDARVLGRGMIGVDGRTEHPDIQSFVPNHLMKAGYRGRGPLPRGALGMPMDGVVAAQYMNGGVPLPAARPAKRFGEEQQQRRSESLGRVQHDSHQNEAARGDAPSLVAAINRLTKDIPPAALPAGIASNGQRIPSGDDFPALSSAPLSPSTTDKDDSNSVSAAPTKTVAEVLAAPAPPPPAPASVPAAPGPAPVVEDAPAPIANGKERSASQSTADEFVVVSHEDAAEAPKEETPAAAPVAPVKTQAPKISWASAAAKGASVVTTVSDKSRKPAPVGVSVKVEDKDRDQQRNTGGEGVKQQGQKKKGANYAAKGERRNEKQLPIKV